MSELDFSKQEYDAVVASTDAAFLTKYADHPSRYIRARVAGNPHTPRTLRDTMRRQPGVHSAITLWILENPSCEVSEYREIFSEWQTRSYEPNVHPHLADNQHTTIDDLRVLLRMNQWCVTMSVLNNRSCRTELPVLIAPLKLLPDEDTPWEKWTEVERLAFYRTFGRRTK